MDRLYWILCWMMVCFIPVWSAGGATFIPVGGLVDGGQSKSNGISADGSVVVGMAENPPITLYEACRWEEGITEGLGDLPGGEVVSEALAVSADGLVVVGYGDSLWGTEAFSWEEGELVRTACHLVTRHLHLCENQGWVCVIEGWAGLGVRLLICLLVLHLEEYGVRGV